MVLDQAVSVVLNDVDILTIVGFLGALLLLWFTALPHTAVHVFTRISRKITQGHVYGSAPDSKPAVVFGSKTSMNSKAIAIHALRHKRHPPARDDSVVPELTYPCSTEQILLLPGRVPGSLVFPGPLPVPRLL